MPWIHCGAQYLPMGGKHILVAWLRSLTTAVFTPKASGNFFTESDIVWVPTA
jgi:hypothetical protein